MVIRSAKQESPAFMPGECQFAPAKANALSFYPSIPCRIFDTRGQPPAQPFTNILSITPAASCSLPVNAQSFVLNATVLPVSTLRWLTLWPDGSTQPTASTLNAYDGMTTSNMAIVPTANGLVDAFASETTHLILDIAGYFAP